MHDSVKLLRPLLLVAACLPLASGCAWWHRWRPPQAAPEPALGETFHASDPYGFAHNGPALPGAEFGGPDLLAADEELIDLREQVERLESAKQSLQRRVYLLTDELEVKESALAAARSELLESQAQLKRARADLAAWQADVDRLQQQLRDNDDKHRQALDSVVGLLDSLIQQYGEDQTLLPAGHR
jgi:hypothetical protein